MKLHLTCTILLLVLLTGCKKEEQQPQPEQPTYNTGNPSSGPGCPSYLYISGDITDSLTGTPVEGISVGPSLVLTGLYGVSDVNGNYTLPIYYNPCWKYAVLKPNGFDLKLKTGQAYYMNPDHVDLTSVQKDDTAYRNIAIIPYSELNVHITGDGTPLSIKDFAPNKNNVIDLGNTTDTIVSRQIYSNRNISIQFFADGELHTTIHIPVNTVPAKRFMSVTLDWSHSFRISNVCSSQSDWLSR